ncbi:MAG: hypothetical protein U0271_42160 [Polyangiaceae bacterium]
MWLALVPLLALAPPRPVPSPPLRPSADAWQWSGAGGIRGITLGPIESARHPRKGYGSDACGRALDEVAKMGGSWVSLTPFGRVHDLTPLGIDPNFEAPFEENRKAVLAAAEQAHRRGLSVMLVPHLWVESGEWRALIDPGSDEAWEAWAASYRDFVLAWARVAAEANIEILSIGVELRSWVTTPRVELLLPIVQEIRSVYPGLLTYSSNWDDARATLLWDAVDLVGINAFYPLASHDGATLPELRAGGSRVVAEIDRFAEGLRKPVLLTEIGYTTRTDPAIRPWEWPEDLYGVTVDEQAQADAYDALLGAVLQSPNIAGFFVWRYFADPDDVSQEAAWGFSPRGKLAEVVLRDAFVARFEVDGARFVGDFTGRHRARSPWRHGWESQPPLFEADLFGGNGSPPP